MGKEKNADEIVQEVIDSSVLVGVTDKGWGKWRTDTPLAARYGGSGLTELGNKVLELYRGEEEKESWIDTVHILSRIIEHAILERDVGSMFVSMEAEEFIDSDKFWSLCEVLNLRPGKVRGQKITRLHYPTWLQTKGDLEGKDVDND